MASHVRAGALGSHPYVTSQCADGASQPNGLTTIRKTSVAMSSMSAQVPARAIGSAMTCCSSLDPTLSGLASAAVRRRAAHGFGLNLPAACTLTRQSAGQIVQNQTFPHHSTALPRRQESEYTSSIPVVPRLLINPSRHPAGVREWRSEPCSAVAGGC